MATSTKESIPDAIRTREGQELQRLLKARNITHQQVADSSGIGTKAYISQIVNGIRPLNIDSASRLARSIGARIDDFSPRLADMVREAHAHVIKNNTAVLSVATMANEADTQPLDFSGGARRWPFVHITPSEYMLISPEGRAELEAIARGMYMEASRTAKAHSG